MTTLTLATGANTYTGPTTINGGTLLGGAANALSAASTTEVLPGGVLDLGGFAQTVSSLAGAGTVINSGASAATLTNQGASSTFSGVIQDGAVSTSLVQNSPGNTLTLTGANTYSGPTTVHAGTLRAGAMNAFSAASVTTVNFGGTLDLGGLAQKINTVNLADGVIQNGRLDGSINAADGTINGIGGSASVDVTDFIVMKGSNGYTGATVVDVDGQLMAGGPNTFSPSSATTVKSTGFLDLHGFDQTVSSLQGGGRQRWLRHKLWNERDAILTNQGASSTFSGSIADGATAKTGLTQNSSGNTLTLGGANTYSGPTTVQAGTLMSGATNAFSAASVTTVNAGGILDLGGFAQTINSVSLTGGTIRDGSLTGAIGSTGGTVNGIGGAASLTTTARTTTLQGTNTYTGATNVNGGTLIGGAANAFSAASATTVAGGATLDLGGFNQTVSSVSLAGAVIQNGADVREWTSS